MLNVIVPYRERAEHLTIFAPYISAYLDASGISHKIYIIEQGGPWRPFNRGALLNAGFIIAKHEDTDPVSWFVFHDVDMLPVTANYAYCEGPTHLVTDASQFENGVPYDGYFGGVTAFNGSDFQTINGFSNGFWGWGSEDDDLLRRCKDSGLTPIRRAGGIFRSLSHEVQIDPEMATANFERLQRGTSKETDGLTSLIFELAEELAIMPNVTKYTIIIE